MASIRERAGTWQVKVQVRVRVRRKDYPDEVASFRTKTEAQKWVRHIEAAMDQETYQSTHAVKDILLMDVLQRYMEEVTPSKRGSKREAEGIKFIQCQKIAAYSMTKLTPAVVAAYRDERLKTVSGGTIIRELSILSGIITHGVKNGDCRPKPMCNGAKAPYPTRPHQGVVGRRGSAAA